METKDFKKLLEEEDAKKILKQYMFKDLPLSDKQLDIVIDLKNKKITLDEVLNKLEKRKKHGRTKTKNDIRL